MGGVPLADWNIVKGKKTKSDKEEEEEEAEESKQAVKEPRHHGKSLLD